MNIGERIKEVRKAKGLTQYQFAQALGITKSHISNVESGTANPSESLIRTICFTFGVSKLWLKTGEGNIEQDEVKGCASHQEPAAEPDNLNALCAKVDMLIATINRLTDGILETQTQQEGIVARLKRKIQSIKARTKRMSDE